jgi:hypothetical protein
MYGEVIVKGTQVLQYEDTVMKETGTTVGGGSEGDTGTTVGDGSEGDTGTTVGSGGCGDKYYRKHDTRRTATCELPRQRGNIAVTFYYP